MTHDKAIEAALDAYYNDGDSNEEEHRQKMRRAVAAFLRAWEGSETMAHGVYSAIQHARKTADELEGK